MASDEAVQLFARVPLFSGCTEKELRAVAQVAKEVEHPEGAVLAREGDRGIGFFLIVDGNASVTIEGRQVATIGAGDFFGEISLLDEGPRTATVTATTPIRLLGITAWDFHHLVEHTPSIAPKLLKVMAARLRSAAADVTH